MDAKSQAELDRLQKAIDQLAEHYDTVHVFATRYNPHEGTTMTVNKGCGNYYARMGQVQEWMVKNNEEARVGVRPDNPDDGWKNL